MADGAEEPFVGRRRELKALAVSLEAAQSGKGRLDIVSGVPGIGKTRLAREIARAASQRGMRVLRGGCWEGGGAPAYWLWADVLRGALDTVGDGRASNAADFAFLLDAAAARAGIPLASPVDVSHDAQQARFVLFDRFCEFLAATAATQAALVVIDDVQWADAGSLLLLQFLAARLADQPLALLITSREPVSDMTAAVTRHAWARHLVLSGLSRAEAGALIEARTARRPAREVLHRLMQLTEGNPYFLRELGSQLVDGTPDFDPTGSIALPTSLLIAARQPYHRLSPGCRTLIQAAAVIGREFGADLAASAAGITDREALALLDQAVERRVIVGMGTGRYRFAHALLREAIREELHLSERIHLHEQIALALERRLAGGETVSSATLAHHFSMGLPLTDRLRAASHSLAAGQEAHRACAFEEAVFQLRRARELSGPALSDSECCDLLLLLGAAEAGAGEWACSRRTFEDAAALARRIESPHRFARAALGFKGMMLGTIPVDVEAVALLREALERIGDAYPALRVELYAALSLTLYFARETEPVQDYIALAIDLARSLNSDRHRAIALNARTMANLRPNKARDVRRDADELLHIGFHLRDPMILFQARICRYWALLVHGDAQAAIHELIYARELAAKTRHPRPLWQVALLDASHALARGQFALASRLTGRAADLGRRVHDSSPAQHSLIQSFQRARLTKDFGIWITSTAQSLDHYPSSIGYLAAKALLYAELGHTEQSYAAFSIFQHEQFTNIPIDGYYLYTLGCLAEAAPACAPPEAAAALYKLLKPYQSLSIVAGWGTVIDGPVSHYLGILARSVGEFDVSREHFEEAIRKNSTLGAPPLLARTQLEYARLCALEPTLAHRGYVRQLLGSATRILRDLGLDASRFCAHQLPERRPSASAMGVPSSPSDGPSKPSNALLRNGDIWTLRFQDVEVQIQHRLGLHYIAFLLRARGEPVHVLDLVPDSGSVLRGTLGSPALGPDQQARHAYKTRLKLIENELRLAIQNNDLGQIDLLEQEKAALISQLSYLYGISGRPRPSASPAERARISVKNRITAALSLIKIHHEPAYRHLSRSLDTGTYCRYLPSTATIWEV